jgi:hypothetical protein
VILAVVAYGFFGHGSDHKSLKDAGFTPVSGFKVETPAFRFEMPDTPTIEPVSASSLGVELTGKAWTIKNGDMTLQVIAIDYGKPQDDSIAQAGFSAVVQGMARRAGGEVVNDEPLQSADGPGRRSEIEFDSGRIFIENYARDSWVVSISVGTTGESPPTAYSDLVSSFEFL